MDLSEYVSKKQEAAIGNSLRKNAGLPVPNLSRTHFTLKHKICVYVGL